MSLNVEFLGKLVDESMDPPGRDDEERLDEETPEEDLFNKNQGQKKTNKLSTPLAEDQQLILKGQDLVVVVPGVWSG